MESKKQKIHTTMAKKKYLEYDFKPTPMLFGEEGRRFLESTTHVRRESKKKLLQMEKDAKEFMAAIERGKNGR